MRRFICVAIITAVCFIAGSQSFAQQKERTPVIVELFTSEGCAACPPADKYLQKLSEDQPVEGVEIIVLAEHVDYWNRLGWTDPFSSALFSKRQNYYANFFNQKAVFTPQMIVDGTRELREKDGDKPFVDAARDQKSIVKLSIEKEAGNTVSLKVSITKLPAIAKGDQAFVLLAVTENNLISNVLSGENSGRKLKHMAIVRNLEGIGEATGEETTLSTDVTLKKDWKHNDLSLVAFVQEARGRRILGAAKVSLKQ